MTDILATSRHRRDRHSKEAIIDRDTHHRGAITDRDRHHKTASPTVTDIRGGKADFCTSSYFALLYTTLR